MCRPSIALLGALIAMGACQAPESRVELTRQSLALSGDGEFEACFDTCMDLLRRRGFELDRVDRRAGIVTTFPQTSQHCFEFWRRDVATPYDWLEASICTLRRRVEIEIERPADGAAAVLSVSAPRERFSTPDRQYNSSGAAFLVYSQALPATTGRQIVPSQDEYWMADGRDSALEAQFLREITGYDYSVESSEIEAPGPPGDAPEAP